MGAFKKEVAEKAIRSLHLEDSNQQFADYWLSLWQDDDLPARASFSPARLKAFLPSLLMYDVIPEQSVIIRLAGTGYDLILGPSLAGKDWIALTPEDYRATRLQTFSTIARGAVRVAYRSLAVLSGDDIMTEEILLPFAPQPNGVHPVLGRVNWRQDQLQRIKTISQGTGGAIDHRLVSLR
jgi:hypothetical protein